VLRLRGPEDRHANLPGRGAGEGQVRGQVGSHALTI
jgi:hypothetical protein